MKKLLSVFLIIIIAIAAAGCSVKYTFQQTILGSINEQIEVEVPDSFTNKYSRNKLILFAENYFEYVCPITANSLYADYEFKVIDGSKSIKIVFTMFYIDYIEYEKYNGKSSGESQKPAEYEDLFFKYYVYNMNSPFLGFKNNLDNGFNNQGSQTFKTFFHGNNTFMGFIDYFPDARLSDFQELMLTFVYSTNEFNATNGAYGRIGNVRSAKWTNLGQENDMQLQIAIMSPKVGAWYLLTGLIIFIFAGFAYLYYKNTKYKASEQPFNPDRKKRIVAKANYNPYINNTNTRYNFGTTYGNLNNNNPNNNANIYSKPSVFEGYENVQQSSYQNANREAANNNTNTSPFTIPQQQIKNKNLDVEQSIVASKEFSGTKPIEDSEKNAKIISETTSSNASDFVEPLASDKIVDSIVVPIGTNISEEKTVLENQEQPKKTRNTKTKTVTKAAASKTETESNTTNEKDDNN